MIKVDHVETYGWEAAIRGMRNPLNSWDKSDTSFFTYPEEGVTHEIGPNDLALMKKLSAAGSDHGKFLRMITVTCDITAPLYWWKEFDTYKVGTVANSCSTMHTVHKRPFTPEDFSSEMMHYTARDYLEQDIIEELNYRREKYLETQDKAYWWDMIQLLPTSYNQKRTVQLNYAVLKNIYHSRRNHKLDEWNLFCAWIGRLPHSELITA